MYETLHSYKVIVILQQTSCKSLLSNRAKDLRPLVMILILALCHHHTHRYF